MTSFVNPLNKQPPITRYLPTGRQALPTGQAGSLPVTFFFLLVTGYWLLVPNLAQAATLYWVGGSGDNVGTNANDWSTTDNTGYIGTLTL